MISDKECGWLRRSRMILFWLLLISFSFTPQQVSGVTDFGQASSGLEQTMVSCAPVYRFFNLDTSCHFFTISGEEKDYVLANYPQFRFEGEGFCAYRQLSQGTLPVYRFFNVDTLGHFFTISEEEKDYVLASYPQFRLEGIAFYAFSGDTRPQFSTLPVYRFFNVNTSGHFFTVGEDEKNAVITSYPEFRFEGVAFYVPAGAPPALSWQWRNPRPQGNTLNDVAYGNGMFVSVGNNGSIITSADGTSWESITSGIANDLSGLTYGNGIFVAVGKAGTIVASRNGGPWEGVSSTTAVDLVAIAFGNGMFVAVGASGTILTSTDAIRWESRNSGVPYSLEGIAYLNGTFFGLGANRTILTSEDGIAWNAIMGGGSGYDGGEGQMFTSIAFGNGIYVVANYSFSVHSGVHGGVLTSTDGKTWSDNAQFHGIEPFMVQPFQKIIFAKGVFVAFTGGDRYISSDGLNWYYSEIDYHLSVAYGKDIFIAVGFGGIIASSPDALAWTNIPIGTTRYIYSITFGNGKFVATTGETILNSPDGVDWAENNFGVATNGPKVDFVNGAFFSLNHSDGIFFTSSDGEIWTRHLMPNHTFSDFDEIRAVSYGNRLYVAAGGHYADMTMRDAIFSSFDGLAWSEVFEGGSNHFALVAYGRETFVIMELYGNTILTSPDGVHWTRRDPGVSGISIRSLIYAKGLFLAVGSAGAVLTSPDGINWTERDTGTATLLNEVAFGGDTFVAVGEQGTILTSSDGISWRKNILGTSQDLYGVTFGNDTFVVTGAYGTILQSNQLLH